jgi:hypothetical protein
MINGNLEKKLPTENIDFMKLIKGKEIAGLVRVLKWSPDKELTTSDLEKEQLFSLGFGPFFIKLATGEIIGFDSYPVKKSIAVWKEDSVASADSEVDEVLREKYTGNFAIDSSDAIYSEPKWQEFIDSRIESINIIKTPHDKRTNRRFPNERGILIGTDHQKEFVISFMLIDSVPADLILIDRNQIDKSIGDIEYIEI